MYGPSAAHLVTSVGRDVLEAWIRVPEQKPETDTSLLVVFQGITRIKCDFFFWKTVVLSLKWKSKYL
jgi:hypothetical protein